MAVGDGVGVGVGRSTVGVALGANVGELVGVALGDGDDVAVLGATGVLEGVAVRVGCARA